MLQFTCHFSISLRFLFKSLAYSDAGMIHRNLTLENLFRIRSYKVTEKDILLTIRILLEREIFLEQAELGRHIRDLNLIVPNFHHPFLLGIWDHRHSMFQIEFCKVQDQAID